MTTQREEGIGKFQFYKNPSYSNCISSQLLTFIKVLGVSWNFHKVDAYLCWWYAHCFLGLLADSSQHHQYWATGILQRQFSNRMTSLQPPINHWCNWEQCKCNPLVCVIYKFPSMLIHRGYELLKPQASFILSAEVVATHAFSSGGPQFNPPCIARDSGWQKSRIVFILRSSYSLLSTDCSNVTAVHNTEEGLGPASRS